MTEFDDWGLVEWGIDQNSAPEPVNEPPGDQRARGENETVYVDVEDFVTAFLAPVWQHKIDIDGRATTWCRQWWRHTEAIIRLEALWRAWENLRLDPATGISVWFRDHADYHMAVLTNVDGPFGGCTPNQHKPKHSALPVDPAEPDTLFAPDGQPN